MSSSESRRPVDRLFTRLLVKYGTQWVNQWNGVPMDMVKDDWEAELSGLTWGAINYALEHLPPDRPPATAVAFRKLANGRPEYFRGLPPVKADPERVRAVLGGLRVHRRSDSQEWARELRKREEAGERLSMTQKQAWRQALRVRT